MWHILFFTVTIILLDRLLWCEYEDDFHGKAFTRSDVVSIMIGPAESDCIWQIMISCTDLI